MALLALITHTVGSILLSPSLSIMTARVVVVVLWVCSFVCSVECFIRFCVLRCSLSILRP
jgi:hypothetical protein